MRNRLLKLTVTVCLVLEALTLGAWVRSQYVMDRWIMKRELVLPWTHHTSETRLYLSGGTLELSMETGIGHPLIWRGISHLSILGGGLKFNWGPAAADIWERLGLRFVTMRIGGVMPLRSTIIDAPFWLLALLFGLLPVWRLKPRKKPAEGICVHCGYDLRATPDRCPECGKVPENSGPLSVENPSLTPEPLPPRLGQNDGGGVG